MSQVRIRTVIQAHFINCEGNNVCNSKVTAFYSFAHKQIYFQMEWDLNEDR